MEQLHGSLSKPVLILKSGKKGNLVYSKNTSTGTKMAIQQFKKTIEDIPTHTKTIKEINYDKEEESNLDHYPLVDIITKFTPIHGVIAEENRDTEGVLNPPEKHRPTIKDWRQRRSTIPSKQIPRGIGRDNQTTRPNRESRGVH